MAYYLLKVEQPGERTYIEAGAAKHMIDASSLADAKSQADQHVDEHYASDDVVSLQIFDETGVVATRKHPGTWDA